MDWFLNILGNIEATFFVKFMAQPLYIAATVTIVFALWVMRGKTETFWRFLAPKELYLHPSTRVDIKVAAFNLLVFGTGVLSLLYFQPFVTVWTMDRLGGIFGGVAPETTATRGAIAAVILFLTQDFCRYWNHALHHGTRFLWPFHAVHHSAEVMTPITFLRAHPMYTALQVLCVSVLVGLVQALVLLLLVGRIDAWVIYAGTMAFNAYVFFGAHLRHSHIWISYGRVMEHILISPAQHQIHHSSDPIHHDKNYGEIFAIWDWMFGTLYIPEQREVLTFGLTTRDGEVIPQPHPTLRDAMIGPFIDVWEEIAKDTSFDPNKDDASAVPRP